MDERSRAVADVVSTILEQGAYKVTKCLTEKLTVKATRKKYKGRWRKNDNVDIVVTVGRPNYEERELIKRAKRDNTPYPLKKVKFPVN